MKAAALKKSQKELNCRPTQIVGGGIKRFHRGPLDKKRKYRPMPAESPFESVLQGNSGRFNIVVARWFCSSTFVGALIGSVFLTPLLRSRIPWPGLLAGITGGLTGITIALLIFFAFRYKKKKTARPAN
jgi:hypothetical protein